MIKYFLRVHALNQALSSKGSEEVNKDGYSEYGGQRVVEVCFYRSN